MAEETPSRELLENLVERIDHLERILQTQTARLFAVEQRLGFEPRTRPLAVDDAPREEPAPQTPRETSQSARPEHTTDDRDSDARQTPRDSGPRRQQPPPRATEWEGYAYESHRARSESESAQYDSGGAQSAARDAEPVWWKARPQTHAPAKKRDLESVIGGSWFLWAGILAIVLAASFFLKLAFDNEWIGPRVQVSIGALGGLALLGVAEYLRARGLRAYAFVLSGGGILILYLSIYASYNFYPLLDQPVAFLLMAAVTTVAVLLSVRLDALAVAILGLVGGFLTPVLIS